MKGEPKIEIAGSKESKFWWIVNMGLVSCWQDNKMHDSKREARNEAKAFIKYCLTNSNDWPEKFRSKK